MPNRKSSKNESDKDAKEREERRRDEQRQDETDEDSFPASDPPSQSPMTGVGRTESEPEPVTQDPSGLKSNFKDDKVAQFAYGRKSQASTQHFDTSTNRLRKGNPDVGDVDLGIIEADKPAQKDDNDHYDSADDLDEGTPADR